MRNHLRTIDCLLSSLKLVGPDDYQGDARNPTILTARAAQVVAERAAAELGMDASMVARAMMDVYRAWCAYREATQKDKWHFSGFINSCSFGDSGELRQLCLRNDYYPIWAARNDHPIGPLGRGGEYGGIRELSSDFVEVLAEEVDLSNNFELELGTLLNLPRGLRAMILSNVELNADRRLPDLFADRFADLQSVNLTFNPLGWREAIECLPASVVQIDLSHCGISELPGDLGRRFPQLETLTLSGNPHSLTGNLPRISSLRRLVMRYCDVVDGISFHAHESGASSGERSRMRGLPDGLGEVFPLLDAVDFGGNRDFEIDSLARLPVTIKTLGLSGCWGEKRALPSEILSWCPILEEIDLCYSCFSPADETTGLVVNRKLKVKV